MDKKLDEFFKKWSKEIKKSSLAKTKKRLLFLRLSWLSLLFEEIQGKKVPSFYRYCQRYLRISQKEIKEFRRFAKMWRGMEEDVMKLFAMYLTRYMLKELSKWTDIETGGGNNDTEAGD